MPPQGQPDNATTRTLRRCHHKNIQTMPPQGQPDNATTRTTRQCHHKNNQTMSSQEQSDDEGLPVAHSDGGRKHGRRRLPGHAYSTSGERFKTDALSFQSLYGPSIFVRLHFKLHLFCVWFNSATSCCSVQRFCKMLLVSAKWGTFKIMLKGLLL